GDSAGRQALARRHRNDRDVAHRHSRISRRQGGGLAGTGAGPACSPGLSRSAASISTTPKQMIQRKTFLHASLLALGVLAAASAARAQDTFPSRPIRIVVTFGA